MTDQHASETRWWTERWRRRLRQRHLIHHLTSSHNAESGHTVLADLIFRYHSCTRSHDNLAKRYKLHEQVSAP